MSDEIEITETIEANTTFFAAAKISKDLAVLKRESPDISTMCGVRVSWRMASGDTKSADYYWRSEAEMKEKLGRILVRYADPKLDYIHKH